MGGGEIRNGKICNSAATAPTGTVGIGRSLRLASVHTTLAATAVPAKDIISLFGYPLGNRRSTASQVGNALIVLTSCGSGLCLLHNRVNMLGDLVCKHLVGIRSWVDWVQALPTDEDGTVLTSAVQKIA